MWINKNLNMHQIRAEVNAMNYFCVQYTEAM